jgi:hypothetical protein
MSSSGTVNCLVIQLMQQLLRQPVQHGVATLNGVASVNIPISAIGPRGFLIPLGSNEQKGDPHSDIASCLCRVYFSNPSTVSVVRQGIGGVTAPTTVVASFCVVDPK